MQMYEEITFYQRYLMIKRNFSYVNINIIVQIYLKKTLKCKKVNTILFTI
jgi:hypothetical protein